MKENSVRLIGIGRLASAAALLVGASLIPAAAPAGAGAATCQEQNYPVTVAGTQQNINGTLCVPDGATTIQILVPGGTYNAAVWEYQPQGAASYREAMNNAGFATLNMDRLGSGKSSHPFNTLVTGPTGSAAIHQVITKVRERFAKVILVGHSLGSGLVRIEAATYHDVDGVVSTGLAHMFNAAGLVPVFTSVGPVTPLDPDPLLRGRGLDLGYVTTLPGRRNIAFHLPAQDPPGAIEYDESHRDVAAAIEAADIVRELVPLTSVSGRITAPVLLAMGEKDGSMCGGPVINGIKLIGADCSSAAALKASEQSYFGQASSFDTFIVPEAGHSFVFHPTAPQFYAKMISWAAAHGL
ncbi:alpha/beta fold hydrolase [Pseudonocardiaceae bacterium YIM PH 21723]|nr:alpha/beta fold hydrolase [Pseudonocardiaceae bacterium YIM PH 21723]